MVGEIYCIENLVNGKRYIGKTVRGWEYRWSLHKRDMDTERCYNYPLYRAMRKYGIENFKCYKIEDTDHPNEREKYWIKFYDTFNNGYNATLGGDGRAIVGISDEEFIAAYEKLGNVRKVGLLFGVDHGTVSSRLKKNGIELKKPGYNSRSVIQCNLIGDSQIEVFPSCRAAARKMIEIQATGSTNEISIASNIRLTAAGERNSAYGFRWKFAEEDK